MEQCKKLTPEDWDKIIAERAERDKNSKNVEPKFITAARKIAKSDKPEDIQAVLDQDLENLNKCKLTELE